MTAINLWLNPVAAVAWIVALICFLKGFVIALLHSKPDKRIVRSLINIPKFIFYQIISLLLIKKANKISVATQHYESTSINEIKA
jgi:hypothetical protein